jgi:hypothetical protein
MFGMVVDGGITKCRMSGPMDTQWPVKVYVLNA